MNAQVFHKTEATRPVWAAHIQSELDLVESRLETAVDSDVSTALDLSMHLFSAGGKRIRPALVIMSALASGSIDDGRLLIDLAGATELIHTASLVHDDVVDETRERRGAVTATAKWGNKISVLGGDFLLAKAFSLLAGVGNMEVIRALSDVAVKMTESEILQASSEGDLSSWEAHYWRIIEDKTAAFMAACCECGAILSGADQSSREALSRYGLHLGLAFQITDDVLDIAGDPAQTGKDAATDLMHGKFTLPVLLALREAEGSQRAELLRLLDKGFLSRTEAQEVAQLAIDSGAVDMARAAAREHIEQACVQLSVVAPSDYTISLQMLAHSVVDRES